MSTPETTNAAPAEEQAPALTLQAVETLITGLKSDLATSQKANHKQGEQIGRILSDMAMSVKKIEASANFSDALAEVKAKLEQMAAEPAAPAQESAALGSEQIEQLSSKVAELAGALAETRAVVAAQADVVLAIKNTQGDLIEALSSTLSTLLDEIRELKEPAKPTKKKGFFKK